MVLLQLEGIGRTYPGPPAIVALRAVSVIIRPGELVAVVGPSGSGKSTLLNVLGMLDLPTTGSYLVDGVDASELCERARAAMRRDTFGFVFQSFHLQEHLTAVENVEVGLLYQGVPAQERRVRAVSALERVGLGGRLDHSARLLSGGERQRVAIARAIVADPAVIVADEPTGSLDSANGRAVLALLRAIADGGTTVILVTHDRDLAAVAPRCIELRDGAVVGSTVRGAAATAVGDLLRGPVRRGRIGLRSTLVEARRALGAAPTRTLGVVAVVAVAVGLVVTLLGLTQTSSAQVSDRFDVRRSREIAVTDAVGAGVSAASAGATASLLEARAMGLSGVTAAAVVVNGSTHATSASTARGSVPLEVVGATPSLLHTVGGELTDSGGPQRLRPREAWVGDLAAGQLDLATVGDGVTVFVDGQAFAVAGVLRRTSREIDLRSSVIVPVNDLPLVAIPTTTRILVDVVPGAAPQVAARIAVALDPVAPERFEVDAPGDPRTLQAEIEGDVRSTMAVLALLALVAAAAMTAVVTTSSVRERYGEMGLRRAIGARPGHLHAQISCEAALVGVLGGLIGLAVGLAAVLVVTIVRHWQPTLDLRAVPLALGGGIVVSTVGGLAAARSASRVAPIDALRR